MRHLPRITARLEEALIRLGVLATAEGDALYSYLDDVADRHVIEDPYLTRKLIAAYELGEYRRRHQAHPLPGQDPAFDQLMADVAS